MAEENKDKKTKESVAKDNKTEVKQNVAKEKKESAKETKKVTEEKVVNKEVKNQEKEEVKKFEQVKTENKNNEKVKKEKAKKEKAPKEKKEKKGVAVRIIVIVIILLAIIGLIYLAIPSPEKVINNTFSDLKNGDFENIEQYIDYEKLVEDTGIENDSEEKMTPEEMDKEKLLYKDFEWKIKSVKNEGETATVEVETTNKDYKTIFNNYFQTLIQKVFSNEELSDEQTEEAFIQELEKDDIERVTTTQTITLTKQDGKWRITVDENIKNAVFPGLQDAINSINNIVG